jgi:hypothetical protein
LKDHDMNPNDYSPERIADRMQIQDTMYRWCRSVDRLDFDAMRQVFHPEAVDHHGAFDGGVEGLIDWIGNRHRTIPFSMHAVSNMLIEFAGPTSRWWRATCAPRSATRPRPRARSRSSRAASRRKAR